MVLASVNLVALLLPLAVVAIVAVVYVRARRRVLHPDSRIVPVGPSFEERPLADVERSFERLVAEGLIEVERAPVDGRAAHAVPPNAGPSLRRLLKEHGSIRLVEADLRLDLRALQLCDDTIGGWRIGASDEAVDIRVGVGPTGDEVLDATWSPTRGGEVMRHSTIMHFIVRAAVGDRIER